MKARATIGIEDYEKSTDGIYTTSVSEATIDEAPMAYKPIEEIVRNIEPTVSIEKIIRPVYNFKAAE
nr:MAG TPA: tRNA-splicing ligase RtcB [Caudoviricetes sp.]